MLLRLAKSVSPRRVPVMSRASYRGELVTSMTLPVAVSLVEGGVAGFVAAKVFHASEAQVATITAAGMFAHLTSYLWTRLTRGLPKVPSIAAMMGALAVCVGAVALLPVSPAGAWMLVCLVVLARCLISGIVTVRSTVWRHNYPRTMRGRITSRLAIVVNLMLLVAPMLGSLALDADARAFRVLYPVGAAVSVIGIVSFAGIRLRGERSLLRFERSAGVRPTPHGEAAPIYEYDERDRGPRPGMLAVLRRDPLFRRYMLWQFFAGVSNMMVEPVLIYMAARETESLRGGFFVGITLTHGLPVLLTVLSLPLWAGRLDRMHVTRFRVEQAWLWTASQLIIWAGAVWAGPLWATILILALGRTVLGIARGGGVLAWNLGHNDFASREMVAVYMGINVTLTGVRGAFAPFLGMALYTGWDALSWPGAAVGAFGGIGGHVFAVSAVFSFISLVGFWTLERRMKRLGSARSID